MTDHVPADASADPQRPPISAWLELDGRPSHHVKRFQMIAAISAERTVSSVTAFVSTRPEPIVFATAVPDIAPIRLNTAASVIACLGVRTFVETEVAIALAAS